MFDFLLIKNRYTEFQQLENICKSNIETEIIINFLKEVKLKGIKRFNIDNFFNSRAISIEIKNPLIINLYKLYDMVKKEINKKDNDMIFLYLVEKKENGSKEIYKSWTLKVND